MIGRIVIENYKSIESLSLDLGRVTVLIGANGSGKSNILEAIALCSAAAANKLDNEFLFSRGIRVSDNLQHMFPAFIKSENHRCQISVFRRNDLAIDFSVIVNLEKDFLRSSQSFADFGDFGEPLDYDEMNQKNFLARYNYMQEVIQKRYRYFAIDTFLLFSPENTPLRRFEEEGQIQPLGIRGEGLFKLLTVLARETEPEEGRDKTRLAEIQERLGLLDWFGDFQIGGNVAMGERTLKIRDQYLDGDLAYFTQRSANEGFLFLLFYFTLFVAKETPRFFAVDNIDASLNPKLCAEVAAPTHRTCRKIRQAGHFDHAQPRRFGRPEPA